MKNIIIIETSAGNLCSLVDNFSKENVISSLSKTINVKPEDIEQVGSSASYGIYAVKKGAVSVRAAELHTSTVKFMTNEYTAFFVVNYGKLI